MNPANPPPPSPPLEEEIPSVELPESAKSDQESPPEDQVSPVKSASPDTSLGGPPQAEEPVPEPKKLKEPKAGTPPPRPKIIKSEDDSSPQMATPKEISTAQRLKKGKIFNLIAAILLSLSLAGLIWVVNFLLRKFG